jgi:hypothetical protein
MARHVLEEAADDHDGVIATVDGIPETREIIPARVILELENG